MCLTKRSLCLRQLDLEEICDAAIQTIRRVQRGILEDVRRDPEAAFESVSIGLRAKPLLAIDLVAERHAIRELQRRLRRYGLLVVGEESLRDQTLDFSREEQLVALVDMVDGSDLLQHNLANWCSAMVFYDPPQQEIVAAFVGLPGEGIYMAKCDSPVPIKYLHHGSPRFSVLPGPSQVTSLANNKIAFYGQKLGLFQRNQGQLRIPESA